MIQDLENKIIDLRNSLTVEGKPLIKKKWNDAQIKSQIELLMNQKVYSTDALHKKIEELVKLVPDELTIEEAQKWISQQMYEFVNWKNEYLADFWSGFGSAPYTLRGTKNEKLIEGQKLGAKGMDEIFGKAFENGYSMTYNLNNFLYDVTHTIGYHRNMKALKAQVFTSPYKNLEEIVDSLPEKKAKDAGRVFYMDKTKPLKERIEAFNKYGEKESSIHEPQHLSLNEIFNIYSEQGYYQRHEMINCLRVIDWWIESLKKGRCEIDYSKNEYHPTLKIHKRDYTHSKKAIEKLQLAYYEILFAEGVANFELDW